MPPPNTVARMQRAKRISRADSGLNVYRAKSVTVFARPSLTPGIGIGIAASSRDSARASVTRMACIVISRAESLITFVVSVEEIDCTLNGNLCIAERDMTEHIIITVAEFCNILREA